MQGARYITDIRRIEGSSKEEVNRRANLDSLNQSLFKVEQPTSSSWSSSSNDWENRRPPQTSLTSEEEVEEEVVKGVEEEVVVKEAAAVEEEVVDTDVSSFDNINITFSNSSFIIIIIINFRLG